MQIFIEPQICSHCSSEPFGFDRLPDGPYAVVVAAPVDTPYDYSNTFAVDAGSVAEPLLPAPEDSFASD